MPEEQPTVDRTFDVRIYWKDRPMQYVEDVRGYSVESDCLFLSGEFDGKQWINCITLVNILEYRVDES